MQIAVAWASTKHEVFQTLKNNKEKITKLVVGTHFYQTDPEFLEEFINCEKVRVVKNSGGVFHPKIYYFQISSNEWECLIGSANFTKGAMNQNKEILLSISSDDSGAYATKNDIWEQISNWFKEAEEIDSDYLQNYRKHHKDKQKALQILTSGSSTVVSVNGYKSDIFSMLWNEYFNEISSSDKLDVEDRLKVINEAQSFFKKHTYFEKFSDIERKKIAGFYEKKDDGIDWLLFGSMKGSGAFKKQINLNSSNISLALDQIPLHDTISEQNYQAFIRYFKIAFDDDKNRLATATRLLAMKRPDYFICLDSENKKQFCSDFGLKEKDITLENYWEKVVDQMFGCPWWGKEFSELSDNIEIDVWKSRVAFLDVLYYKSIPRANPKEYLSIHYPQILNNKAIKIVSSRMWEKKEKDIYRDNWWFKFSKDDLFNNEFIVFAGAEDYKNKTFKLLKVPTTFLRNHLDDFDVNADGLMINLYILLESYVDDRADKKVSFENFVVKN